MTFRLVGETAQFAYSLTDPDTGAAVDAVSVAVTVTPPAGGSITAAVNHPAIGEYTIEWPLTSAGQWTADLTATLVGGGVDEARFHVLAVAGAAATLPGWMPDLRDVAVHVPTRTRQVGLDNDYAGTFNRLTTPTGEEATRVIEQATAYIAGLIGEPVVEHAWRIAHAAAAVQAAYWIELAYPERAADVSVYDRLRDDVVRLVEAARGVNAANGGGLVQPDSDGRPDVKPVYSFPDPPLFGDLSFGVY